MVHRKRMTNTTHDISGIQTKLEASVLVVPGLSLPSNPSTQDQPIVHLQDDRGRQKDGLLFRTSLCSTK